MKHVRLDAWNGKWVKIKTNDGREIVGLTGAYDPLENRSDDEDPTDALLVRTKDWFEHVYGSEIDDIKEVDKPNLDGWLW